MAHLEIASLSLVPGASHFQKMCSTKQGDFICLSCQDDREENIHVLTDFFLEELVHKIQFKDFLDLVITDLYSGPM